MLTFQLAVPETFLAMFAPLHCNHSLPSLHASAPLCLPLPLFACLCPSLLASALSAGSKARLWRRICEFNACVPFTGLHPSDDVPDVAVMALLSMLPAPGTASTPPLPDSTQPAGLPLTPLPAPSPRVAATCVSILACIYRLVGATSAFSLVVGMPGAVARVLSLVRSGNQLLAAQAVGGSSDC